MVGEEGLIWILAVLYFISAVLTKFITLPDNAKTLHHVKGTDEQTVTINKAYNI